MIQPSLSFLALPIPAAMNVLGSFRTLDHLPNDLAKGVIDLIEALMNCFPNVSEEYYGPMDNLEKDFNHVEVAYKVLAPAVEKAAYPLQGPHGLIDEDTSLAWALTEDQAMDLIFDCRYVLSTDVPDSEEQVIFRLVDHLLESDPVVAAEMDRMIEDPAHFNSFNYCLNAHRLLSEAKLRNGALLPLAA